MKEKGRKNRTKSYMWLYATGEHALHQIRVFEYQPTRAGFCASEFLEIQRNSAGDDPKCAACHSGVLDANSMPRNEQDYSKKAETFTIFITEHDVLKGNLPIYYIDRTIAEMDVRPFEDGSHIIYVNGAYQGDKSTPLGC